MSVLRTVLMLNNPLLSSFERCIIISKTAICGYGNVTGTATASYFWEEHLIHTLHSWAVHLEVVVGWLSYWVLGCASKMLAFLALPR
jgi:hypothetical protein